MNPEYKKVNDAIRLNISRLREINAFRKDSLAIPYIHTRVTLSFDVLARKSNIKRLIKSRECIRQGKEIEKIPRKYWSYFDGCSYDELTDCIEARYDWIEECENILHNTELASKYPYVIRRVRVKRNNHMRAIKEIEHIQAVMKATGMRDWRSTVILTK